MKISSLFLLLFIANLSLAQNAKPYYYDPAMSPDGKELAFVSGGDIWTVSSIGGEARLLVSHTANETRPLYSPDGRSIAFISTRTGNGDIYVLNIGSGVVHRLTYDDGFDDLHAWSHDGKYIYFSSNSRDISGMRDVYRVKSTGGTPMPVADDRYVSEHFAAPSPDGKTVAFSARGVSSSQWWRLGSSHLDESEIWLLNEGDKKFTKVAERGARQIWPMWSRDGKTLYYVSDRNGQQNLWVHPVGGVAKPLTSFKNGRVLWPSISYNGETIVFERDFGIWKYDVAKGSAAPVSISLRGVSVTPSVEVNRMTSGFSNMSVSPDGKKIAFTARGDVFVSGTKDGGEATRITSTPAMESQLKWLSNSNSIVYLSSRSGNNKIYRYDFINQKESQLTTGTGEDVGITISGDGKKIAFIRNNSELRVLDLAALKETAVTKGNFNFSPIATGGSIAWSPDNQWIAYAGYGAKSLRNIYVVSAAGGESRPVSFLANTFGGDVAWSGDGKTILFTTGQRTENGMVARIDLQPRQPRFREDQFRDLFAEPTKTPAKAESVVDSMASKKENAATKPAIVWEGISQRLSFLPISADVNSLVLSKDGNTVYMMAAQGDQVNIFSYSIEELPKEPAVLKQITSTPGFKSEMQLSADGKEIYYMEGGRIVSVGVESKAVKPLSLTAEVYVDFNKEKMQIFHLTWDLQNKGFYDEGFHGVDWQAVKKNYEPLAAGAQTPDELRRILNLMVGELNASHSGVGGSGGSGPVSGRPGLRFDRAVYEKEGALKITEVIAFSPAALAGNINPGDFLTAVDGQPINGNVNLDQLFENKINRRVVLTVASNAGGKGAREIVIKPVSPGVEKGLLYKQWVQQNREYVARISGGRLGYVHMFDMGQPSLNQFHMDLDAENHLREGVVVDIRNNNGGFVNAYALDVLSRRGYMTMQARGLPPAPARVQLGQRALDAPTILVTNQHSLSDAEDFSEGYRVLGLGKIVGEPTASWIIYTSNFTLFDGTSVRLPFIKVTDNQGKDMELSPRPVDIKVTNPIGEMGDKQLDVAVKELLAEIGKKR